MKKCSPVEMRKNLQLVEEMEKVGMDFVPIPVFGEMDKKNFLKLMETKLVAINNAIDEIV